MVSVFGRFVIAFNGEIYNHIMIRTELEKLGRAPLWRGHSDTETLLAGFEVFGVESYCCDAFHLNADVFRLFYDHPGVFAI
jgi:asparagine synthetase B (glutamine-hydrolysing)